MPSYSFSHAGELFHNFRISFGACRSIDQIVSSPLDQETITPLMSKSERSTVLSLSDSGRVVDPLLKDLEEKKQTFRRNVVSIAAELKDVRSRLASQEQSFVRETLTRKEAETKAKNMEYEIHKLEKKLEDRNNQLEASALAAEKYLKDLDDLRSQLAMTKETAETSAASAQSAELQCRELAKELGEKTCNLKEHEERVTRLGQQLDDLQRDLRSREFSQKQLKDEVLRVENEMMQAVANAGSSRKDCEFSPKNLEMINELLVVKDEEIGRLRDEIRIMSVHWKIKTKEMEAQLEKQRRADQELKKKVLKLEFCLQEARSQTRKLQRMGERRDKAIRELKEQLAAKERKDSDDAEKPNFWETSSFKIVVSMSMLVLVMFSKR